MKKQNGHHSNLSIGETAELFHVSSSTISNWIKEGLLKLDADRCVTKESLRRFQTDYAGKSKLNSRANKLLKDMHDVAEVGLSIQTELDSTPFDDNIGQRYEAMLSDSYRNREGIYYTPMTIVDDMLKGVEANESTTFLDPCCGSGNFLIKAIEKGVSPMNVYGFDTDPNAVMIARRRIKELTGCEPPHVICADFLEECQKLGMRFDLVFTNPPWGKKLPKSNRMRLARQYQAGGSADTCSLFLFAVLSVLRSRGVAGLLMPDSFFKIAVFEDARRTVLQETIHRIVDYGKPFENMYSAVSIIFQRKEYDRNHKVCCHFDHEDCCRLQKSFLQMPGCNLNYWTKEGEMRLIEELLKSPHFLLKEHASWGMGIVTGNNAKICKRSRRVGLKPVYRGKDILPGKLKAAKLFINPADFPRCHQMAPMAMFLAPEKLIYRFISNDLVFFCDTKQRFFLNSANMLVLDEGFPLTTQQLAEILNSPLTNWLFKQLFNTHKVLRGDLERLPIITDSSLHRRFDLFDFNG